jgi:hypothetical protein
MKTKLILLLLFIFASCSKEDEKELQKTALGCDCEISYYLFIPDVGGTQQGTYEFMYSEDIDFDCVNNDFGDYFVVSNANYNRGKIECR